MKSVLFACVGLLGFASSAAAQITAANIGQSQWDTTYSAGGQRIPARLTFNGTGGSYVVNGAQGSVSNVKYDVRLGGGATISGNWSFNGNSGTFTFFVAGNSNPTVFSGSWQANGRSGGWNGKFVQIVQGGGGQGGGGQVVYDKNWSYNMEKDYYYKTCTFPAGGYQYIIYYKVQPKWLYWYNPTAQVFWCACPTVNHPKWGDDIKNGKDLFLMADTKARSINDTVFPSEGDDGANFKKGAAKDKDGSMVNLSCPPPDLP